MRSFTLHFRVCVIGLHIHLFHLVCLNSRSIQTLQGWLHCVFFVAMLMSGYFILYASKKKVELPIIEMMTLIHDANHICPSLCGLVCSSKCIVIGSNEHNEYWRHIRLYRTFSSSWSRVTDALYEKNAFYGCCGHDRYNKLNAKCCYSDYTIPHDDNLRCCKDADRGESNHGISWGAFVCVLRGDSGGAEL